MNALKKSLAVYAQTFRLVAASSVFVLLSLLLLPIVSSFVAGGAGFIRFSSTYLDLTLPQALLLIGVTLISLFLLSLFLAALVTIVKLKETLDNNSFSKIALVFPRYVKRVFLFLLIIGFLSILFGSILDAAGAPRAITHAILVIFWLLFTFTPPILVLEDLKMFPAIKDTIEFIKRVPQAIPSYAIFGFVLLAAITVFEVALGQLFVWEHKLVSLLVVSFVALPLLQIFATEYYLSRYPLSKL